MPIRFQVDGDFYDHPKTTGMSDAAFSLWVRAGSYSTAKLSDGFVSEDVLALTLRTEATVAEELVRRGLWRRVKGGYRYHQWDQRNLTKDRVEADREADRERKRAERYGASVTARSVECCGCGAEFATTRPNAKYCSRPCKQRAYRAKPAERYGSEYGSEYGNDGASVTAKPAERYGTVEEYPQVVTGVVRSESERIPNGFRTDSERIPGASVSVSVSVSESVSESGHGSGSAADPPPGVPEEPPPVCPKHDGDPDPPRCRDCGTARRANEAWHLDQARALSVAAAIARSRAAQDRAAAARAGIDQCRQCDQTGYLPGGHLCRHDPETATRAHRRAAEASAALTRKEPA